MELSQLRTFVAVAEELHFGRAAQRLNILPSALSRVLRLLEDSLGVQLLARTTRNVALTEDGQFALAEARALIAQADQLVSHLNARRLKRPRKMRIGAIDTAATGLVPLLLSDIRRLRPDLQFELYEDKTVRLLPRLLSGRLDMAFVRPPANLDKRIVSRLLFHETAIVALPIRHPLARRKNLPVHALLGAPMIVPERRSRPHSHDLTFKLFAAIGARPEIAQVAEEKQTILNLVAAGLGIAIVPRWSSRMAIPGVHYVPLRAGDPDALQMLPLAAAWLAGTRDQARDAVVATLQKNLPRYAAEA